MNPNVYFFLGAPGCGKSTCLDYLSTSESPRVALVRKESTRPARATDGPEVKHVAKISRRCDVRYAQYGFEYGFASRDVWRHLASDRSVAVIVNDIRTLRLMKRRFGALARCVYIHSNIELKGIEKLAMERYPKTAQGMRKDTKRRVEKIKTVHRKYIENTALFDYTLLNVRTLDQLHAQIQNMLDDTTLADRRLRSPVKIFVIAGASNSGKEELVNAMQQMEKERVANYKKATTRPERSGDHGELRHMPEGINRSFNLRYEKQGFTYGISTRELWEDLAKGITNLLVLSDGELIGQLREKYGSICTVLYLHANLNQAELRRLMRKDGLSKQEIAQRIDGIQELFDLYIRQTTLFDHVLLNTAEPEDLYDQAFNILDFYCLTD